MYPTLIKLGSFEITTFGLMMFAAFIVGGWVLTRQFPPLRNSRTTPRRPSSWPRARRHRRREDLLRDPLSRLAPLLDRAGLVWYGGLIGGFFDAARTSWRRSSITSPLPTLPPPLSRRLRPRPHRCFLVGDDYGRPTKFLDRHRFRKVRRRPPPSRWRQFGVHIDPSIPPDQILRVHPTQLYESRLGVRDVRDPDVRRQASAREGENLRTVPGADGD